MKKLNEYEEAIEYYKNDDDPKFNLKEAINNFEIAGLNGYIGAYYDLSLLYLDNVEELGKEAYQKAFDCMKLAADNDFKDAFPELAEMYLEKKYNPKDGVQQLSKDDRINRAIYWYLKSESDDYNGEIRNLIDLLKKKRIKSNVETQEHFLMDLKEWYILNHDEELSKFIYGIERDFVKSIFEEKASHLANEEDYQNLKKFLDDNKKISYKKGLYDEFYLKYGNYKFDRIKTIEDAKEVFDIYNDISDAFSLKKYCISKINYKIGMSVFKTDDKYAALKYFKKVNSETFKQDDLDEILKFINDSLNLNFDLACEYSKCFYKLFEYREEFENSYKLCKDKIKFNEYLEKAQNDDYNAQLIIAHCYAKGMGVEKNIETSLKCYVKIFCKNLDDFSLTILYKYYKSYDKLVNAIRNYNPNCITNKMLEMIKDKCFSVFDEYFDCDNNAIRILDSSTENDLSKMYFDNKNEKCIPCLEEKDCWKKYFNKCANQKYYENYHDDYDIVNRNFLSDLFSIFIKKFDKKNVLTIVLVGCGNLYELEALNDLVLSYPNKRFDVIVLDEGIWYVNSFNKLQKPMRFNKLWFKKCNFNVELQNEIYRKADFIYYSRCLIHYDSRIINSIIPNLRKIVSPNQITAFSQAVDVRYQNPIDFENALRHFIRFECKIATGFCMHKVFGKLVHGKEFISDDISVKQEPMYHYLYIIEGRR